MNRCLPLPAAHWLRTLVLVLAWTLPIGHSLAAAQNMRQFPATAKRGLLLVTAPPEVLIDGKRARLSPGARIKNVNNMLVLSASLAGTSVPVVYVLDTQGMVHEVWLLSAQEARSN
jgi:hypothetical protein